MSKNSDVAWTFKTAVVQQGNQKQVHPENRRYNIFMKDGRVHKNVSYGIAQTYVTDVHVDRIERISND